MDDRDEVAEGPDAASRDRRRSVDPGSLVIGLWFVVLGLVATVLPADTLRDLPRVAVPASFAVTGLALLLPNRQRATRGGGPATGS